MFDLWKKYAQEITKRKENNAIIPTIRLYYIHDYRLNNIEYYKCVYYLVLTLALDGDGSV